VRWSGDAWQRAHAAVDDVGENVMVAVLGVCGSGKVNPGGRHPRRYCHGSQRRQQASPGSDLGRWDVVPTV
jgi:hypothetical protein